MVLPIAVEDVKREVKILKALTGHENVVQFYNAFEDDSYVFIVMEQVASFLCLCCSDFYLWELNSIKFWFIYFLCIYMCFLGCARVENCQIGYWPSKHCLILDVIAIFGVNHNILVERNCVFGLLFARIPIQLNGKSCERKD